MWSENHCLGAAAGDSLSDLISLQPAPSLDNVAISWHDRVYHTGTIMFNLPQVEYY